METERKLLKLPLGFRSKIPRRGIYEYQRPENFAKHNALCKRDENYGILMGKPNNAICLDYDIYDPNCKEKQKYTLEYFKKVCGDDVYISRTPSGGYHAVFRYDARFDTWKKCNASESLLSSGSSKKLWKSFVSLVSLYQPSDMLSNLEVGIHSLTDCS